jgi:hypothetical protein
VPLWPHIALVEGMNSTCCNSLATPSFGFDMLWGSCRYSAGAVLQIMLFGVMAIQVCLPVCPKPAHLHGEW